VEHGCEQLDRYIDDYLYHTRVRPQINAELQSQGVGELTGSRRTPRGGPARVSAPRTAEIRTEIALTPR
jgi:hypothetical protein